MQRCWKPHQSLIPVLWELQLQWSFKSWGLPHLPSSWGGPGSMRIKSVVQMYTDGCRHNTAAGGASAYGARIAHPQVCSITALLPEEASPFGCGRKAALSDHPEKPGSHTAHPSLSHHHCLCSRSAQLAGAAAACGEGSSWTGAPPGGSGAPPCPGASWPSPPSMEPGMACRRRWL